MKIEQFVMAYQVEQDRVRAMLPEGFTSLRPVLRINAEIRDDRAAYLEFNAPVAGFGKSGWLNIAHWQTPETDMTWERVGETVTFHLPFLEIMFTGVGVMGGCPAEGSNEGCFFPADDGYRLVPPERIDSRKEFCDCTFTWEFAPGDAHGVSIGEKIVGVTAEESQKSYPRVELTAPGAAALPCLRMLGQYKVIFERT